MSSPMAMSRRTRRWLVVVLGVVVAVCGWGATQDWSADAGERSVRTGPGTYAFLHEQKDGSGPVTWDGCSAITYGVDGRTSVDGAPRLVAEAVSEVERASGLDLELVDDDPDVTVTWTRPRAEGGLKGDVAGLASTSGERRDGRAWYESGEVLLDGPQLSDISDGPNGDDHVRGVVMHELAHVVGLDHVDDEAEVMHPASRQVTWGPGDLAGLAALGGSCR